VNSLSWFQSHMALCSHLVKSMSWLCHIAVCKNSTRPELQRPRRTTGNCRNLQCGDDSIMWANATRDMGSPS